MQPYPNRSQRSRRRSTAPERTGVLYTRDFVVLLWHQLAFAFSFSTFFLLPKFLAADLHAPPTAIGLVMAMFGLSAIVAMPLLGFGIDRLDRRIFLRAGSALLAVTAFGFLWVDRVGPLAATLRGLQGVGWFTAFTAGLAITSDMAPASRMAEALGVFGVSSIFMNAAAPAVSESLADRAGYGPVFALAGTMAVIATGLSLLVVEWPAARDARRDATSSFLSVLRRPVTWMMAPIIGISGAAFGVMFSFSQPFALESGIHHVSGFFIAYTAGALCVRVGLARMVDRVGRHRVAVAALALYGASLVGMNSLTSFRLVLFGGLFGFAHGIFFPAFNAMVLETTRSHERGTAMTLSNGFFTVGTACVFVLGFAVERMGYVTVFRCTAIATMVGALVLTAWPRVVGRAASLVPSKAKNGAS
jgi:MFS family permease